jgi:protein OS-9
MVVYTPRLCDDVAFLPPREDRANAVQCREIMDPETLAEYYEQKAELERTEALELLQAALGLTAGGAEAEEGQSKVEKKKGKKKKSAVAGEEKKKKAVGEEEKLVLGKDGEGAEEHWHDEL